MEPELSLLHSQVPATCPHPEAHRSSPSPHIPLLEDPSYYYYSPIYVSVFQMTSFSQVSPPKPCLHLSPLCAICPAQLILYDLITRTVMCEE